MPNCAPIAHFEVVGGRSTGTRSSYLFFLIASRDGPGARTPANSPSPDYRTYRYCIRGAERPWPQLLPRPGVCARVGIPISVCSLSPVPLPSRSASTPLLYVARGGCLFWCKSGTDRGGHDLLCREKLLAIPFTPLLDEDSQLCAVEHLLSKLAVTSS